MTTLVIDASIAIKWVVEEAGSSEALALRRFRLSAPDLLIVECANILWKKVRRAELAPEEARLAARLLEGADIDLHPMRRVIDRALALAIDLDHPAYDCVYLSLSEATGNAFVTADERLCRKVRASGLPGQIFGLSDGLRFLEGKSAS